MSFIFKEFTKPMVIAHRGASSSAPENTLSAFKKAIDIGATMIELDVRKTKDEELVVIHNSTLNKTSNGKGLVSSYRLDELKKFDMGGWFKPEFKGEKLPTLKEVLDLCKDKILLDIEIKSFNIEEKIIKLINEAGMGSKVIITSFIYNILKKIKKIDNKIKTGIIVLTGYSLRGIRKKRLNIDAVVPHGGLFLSKNLVDMAHKEGLDVYVWTLNKYVWIKRALKFGVDGIITNHPEIVMQMIS